jgi:uncharacterized membrane protein
VTACTFAICGVVSLGHSEADVAVAVSPDAGESFSDLGSERSALREGSPGAPQQERDVQRQPDGDRQEGVALIQEDYGGDVSAEVGIP